MIIIYPIDLSLPFSVHYIANSVQINISIRKYFYKIHLNR